MKIYKITKGGQGIREASQYGRGVNYTIDYNSDWPEQSRADGYNTYTNTIWSTSLEDLQRWADEWAGKHIELTEKAEENAS